MPHTTIQITHNTRSRLAKLKEHTNANYDELLNALLDLVPSGDDEGKYSEDFKASLFRGLLDIKYGRTYSSQDVRKALGL